MKLKKTEDEEDIELNLTPMIDCVFLLIIFFMTVMNLSSLNIEDVELPRAEEAQEFKSERLDARHILINVLANGTTIIAGKQWNKEQLADYLKIEADAEEREAKNPSNPQVAPSRLYLTVRADKETRYENVQNVFDACSQNGIYKTRVMATRE